MKVLRPNVKRRIARDLKLMESAAALMQILLKDGERLRPKAVVGEFAKHLDEEVNLLWEASNCAQIGRKLRRFHGHCGADRALGMVSPRGHGDAVFKRHPHIANRCFG